MNGFLFTPRRRFTFQGQKGRGDWVRVRVRVRGKALGWGSRSAVRGSQHELWGWMQKQAYRTVESVAGQNLCQAHRTPGKT